MANVCIHAIISGKVQGVCFRQSTKEQAESLGLTGWVKNHSNGSVEVIACGEESDVNTLVAWLQQGPPKAKVEGMNWKPTRLRTFNAFTIESE